MASSLVEPLAVDVAGAAQLIGISRAKTYELVMSGQIPSIKLGARRLVPLQALRDWLAQETRAAEQGK